MNGPRPVPDELVTTRELAVLMRCSVSTVHRLKRDGMPHVAWTRTLVRYRPHEAMTWAAEHGREKAAA